MPAANPTDAIGVLPGVVASGLRALVGVAYGNAIDRNVRRADRGGIIRNNSGESQACRTRVIRREYAGLIATMECRHRLVYEIRADGMGILQRNIVICDEVEFSETWNGRSLEREGSIFSRPLGEV